MVNRLAVKVVTRKIRREKKALLKTMTLSQTLRVNDVGVAPELVSVETNSEQGESGAEESPGGADDAGKNSQQGESSTEDTEAKHTTAADCLEMNATEPSEALGDSKHSEETGKPVTMATGAGKLEPSSESVESELISAEMTMKQESGSEEAKVTEIELDVGRESAASVDSSVNPDEQATSEEKIKSDQSVNGGDIAGIGISSVKEEGTQEQQDDAKKVKTIWYTAEDSPSRSAESSATSEESVSYATSIVGGVVHRVPIVSSSPKGQRKPGEGNSQSLPRKKSMLESLFGLRKKSKGGAESPAAGSTDVQAEKNEDSNKPGNAEKDTMKKPIEASPVPTVIKDTVKLLETGKTSEGEDASVSNNKEEGGVTEDDCKDANIETEGKPVAIEVGDGDVNAITVSNEEEPKQAVETQNVTEDSVPVGNVELEKDVKNGEELRMENPEEAVKTDLTEPVCSGDESSKTAPKKKKSGLFGGIFTRRKSKKSARTLARVAGDTVEALQHADSLVQVSGEVYGTEQGTGTEDAAIKGDEDLTGQQNVETEDVLAHHPAEDQNTDSKNDEVVDKAKVDAVVAGETPEVKVTEMETAEVENIVSEEVQKPSEKTLLSEETVQCAEKPAEEPTQVSVATDLNTKAQQAEDQITQPEIVVNSETATEEGTTNDDRPTTEDLRKDADASKQTGEQTSPEDTQDQATELTTEPRVKLREGGNGSYSPARHMQMRISYAEVDGGGGKEVEVIGESASETTGQKGTAGHRVSCRGLGEADHEGWLSKKGGMLFLTGWKRRWVVLKEGKLYYFKTAFDPEASGVINVKGATVTEAPEIKKNFCFKCEEPAGKPQVSVFLAQSKEDMDKWLTVLKAASKGETIRKSKQQQLTVKGEVTMRKRVGSSTQRHSSVLAVGGRHDFLEDEEDRRLNQRKSTPVSVTDLLEEKQEKGTEEQPSDAPSNPSDNTVTIAPSDEHPAPNDTLEDLSNEARLAGDALQSEERSAEGNAPSRLSDDITSPSETPLAPYDAAVDKLPGHAPSSASAALPVCTDRPSDGALAPTTPEFCDSRGVSEPADEALEEKSEVRERKSSENSGTVLTNEVSVGGEKEVVESSLPPEMSSLEPQTVENKTVEDITPAVSVEVEKNKSEVTLEVSPESEKHDLTADAGSRVDSPDSGIGVTNTEVTTTESAAEIVKMSVEAGKSVETVSVVSEGVREARVASEMESELTRSESSASVESGEAAEDDLFPPLSPSKTRWYFSLDRKQTWSVAPEPEEERSPKGLSSTLTRLARKSTPSDRGSVQSNFSDAGSIKSENDELMEMCHNIRKARLSIVGEPVWEGAERLRAFSCARADQEAMLRLRRLERTLKVKEKDLAELDELLNQPEINRKSIYEWKQRNSVLFEEVFPQNPLGDWEGEGEGGDNVVEGKESEKPNQENLDAANEQEKSNDVEGETSVSKEEGDDISNEKQAMPNNEVKGNAEQDSGQTNKVLRKTGSRQTRIKTV
ncbi:LOW QUALITY PROTEIN: uncharacterized protein LOC114962291 [Acropora millepora]|uniref:LOW QUALITY PROTEIN: uncharacterized protein LOC114962291 n=1 Tax=Acropora millepora TaxID=45264 RepID=UPI001CF5E2B9|nr:LOW QUALITY PROTEIN: uncharacterized protein LOC114962291 [Acropora millepora]